MEPRLAVRGLAKSFGTVPALVDVSFGVEPGEVLAVVGQRGAGKSALFQVLSGVARPTAGEIVIDGQAVDLLSPIYAQRAGIETVHQRPHLAGNLDVLENIFLGRERTASSRWGLWPRLGEMRRQAQALLADFDMPERLLHERVSNLSDEQQQVVMLAHAFCRPARVVLLDDALAALSYERQHRLLDWIRRLAARDVAVILSSDDLKHVFAIANRILVLQRGRQMALRRTAEATPREIVELTIGSTAQTQVTPVIWAIESYHAAQRQAEELTRTQLALRQSLQAQDSLNRQLIERLRTQLEALDRLNLALQDANRRLITEREAERKALARDLHDHIIQELLSYNYQLEETELALAASDERQALSRIRDGIREVVVSLRELCSDLRPPTIDSHGLPAALRSLAHRWSEQHNIAVSLDIDNTLGRLPEPIELSIFRIIQEALSNVRKHAAARNVEISLHRTHAASLVLRVADDGRGTRVPINLASFSTQKHFGLLGISERVSLLGGSLHIGSPDPGGLDLQIEIPSPSPSI